MSSPAPALVLTLVAIGATLAALVIGRRPPQAARRQMPGAAVGPLTGGIVLVAAPLLLAETTVYKLGLVLILLVAVIGLHVLVNWVGELSLAHAAMVGLPAFIAAKASAAWGLSPVALLPLAVAVGLAAGAVVGLPSIRARGLQVALVTLAAGVAIDRFFFTKEWIVGSVSDAGVAIPSIGPLQLTTARALYPVLAVVGVLTVAAAWILYHSKVGRAFLWIKAHPDAAAAFGVPVARYRALAYALAGGFAGLSGGLTTMWVQRLTPEAFPLSRSFTMLIIVALAGRGFVGGVALAAAAIEGGQLFLASADAFITYAAPAGLIFTLTRHPAGLNGLLGGVSLMPKRRLSVRPLLVAGIVAGATGFASIVLAWYHAGNTSQIWIQNQEMILGGLGGLGLVIVGAALSVYDRLLAARAVESERWTQMFELLQQTATEAPARRTRRLKAS